MTSDQIRNLRTEFKYLADYLRDSPYVRDGIQITTSYPNPETIELIDRFSDSLYSAVGDTDDEDEDDNVQMDREMRVIKSVMRPGLRDLIKDIPHDIRYKYLRYVIIQFLKKTKMYNNPSESVITCYSRLNDFIPMCTSCWEVLDVDIMFFLLQYITIGDITMFLGDRLCSINHINKILGLVYNPISKPPRLYPSDYTIIDKSIMD